MFYSTCLDSGRVSCTNIDCFEACIAPPLNASCRMPGTRYYYDAMSAACLNFTGGCGVEGFSNARECYDRCDPLSESTSIVSQEGIIVRILLRPLIKYFLQDFTFS